MYTILAFLPVLYWKELIEFCSSLSMRESLPGEEMHAKVALHFYVCKVLNKVLLLLIYAQVN